MPEIPKDEKTEEPTEKRITKSREEGRTAKSIEVNTVVILLTSLLFFTFFGMWFINSLLLFFRETFGMVAQYEITTESLISLMAMVFYQFVMILGPLLLLIALVGILSNYWQNDGWIFSWKPLEVKYDKLNPLTGWNKFMSKEGLMNLLKSVGKLILVGGAVWLSTEEEWATVPRFMLLPLWQTVQVLGDEVFALVMQVLSVLLVIAIADLAYQKYQYKENLKMTKQEVRDERKDIEGDPIIKARIRQRQYEMFRNRMMAAVPEAEVIITNPTHLSIALRYDRHRDSAPICVGKGAGQLALKIREIAKENDIPIIEDKPLAQSLFKTIDVGEFIPEGLYKAVAEILAYVYRLKFKAM